MKAKAQYTDVFANAFKSVQAWRTVTLVLIGILIFGTFELVRLANERTVILIPQGLASNKSPVSLNLGEPFSPDYITNVAKGDAHFLLDWTPDNVEQQYALFVTRLAPQLYNAQSKVLVAESKQHRDEGVTQSFYVTRTTVKGAVVTLSGVLVRAAGGHEIFRGPATYVLNYQSAGSGQLEITSVSQPEADKPAPEKK